MPTLFEILRDTREQPDHGWTFGASDQCSGTTVATLKTGDYSLTGLEDVVAIERKGSIREFSGNLDDPRFFAELDRLKSFRRAAIILEFSVSDVLSWPHRSGLTKAQQAKVRKKGPYLLKLIIGLMTDYPTIPVIFAASKGKEIALAFLKRAWADFAPLPAPVGDSPDGRKRPQDSPLIVGR